jgi:hypothetical protein
MNPKPLSPSGRFVSGALKACTCLIFLLAALGNAYFAIDGVIRHNQGIWSMGFLLVCGSAFTILSVLFLIAATRTSTDEFLIHCRLFRRYGHKALKIISTKEYERLQRIEKSVEIEVAERMKSLKKSSTTSRK